MVQENYIACSASMESAALAAESISESDLLDLAIHRSGHWGLMPAHAVASCVYPATVAGRMSTTAVLCLLSPVQQSNGRACAAGNIAFSAWLGNFSKTNRRVRLLADLSLRTRSTILGMAPASLAPRLLR